MPTADATAVESPQRGREPRVALREVVGGELRRDAAPAARRSRRRASSTRRAGARRRSAGTAAAASAEPGEHARDREVLRAVAGDSRRRREAGADDADHDRDHREVLGCARRARRASARAKNSSTSRPAASAGCTTTSGASSSATTCSGQPRIDRPVPSSQRVRRTSRRASASAQVLARAAPPWRPSPAARPLGCRASRRRRPPDSQHQIDHVRPRSSQPRSLDSRARSSRSRSARRSPPTCCPASPARWPALRGPLGVEDRTPGGRGYALTFDDGPHAQGTPAVLELLARRARAGDVLPRRRAGAAQPGAGARDRRGRARDRPALPPPSQPAAPGAVAGARGHRARVRRDRGRDRPRAHALPPALRRAQRRRAAAGARRAAGARCCGATGAATGSGARRPRRSPRA